MRQQSLQDLARRRLQVVTGKCKEDARGPRACSYYGPLFWVSSRVVMPGSFEGYIIASTFAAPAFLTASIFRPLRSVPR